MLDAHLIDELRLELAWLDEQSALDGQPRWEALWRNRLAAAAQSVFDAVARPGEVRRYERIEVDMGPLAPGTSPAEAEQRFRERLREALDNARPETASAAAAEPAVVVPRARAELEILQFFLLTGRLPWHASGQTGADPADLLAGLGPASLRRLALWLRSLPPGAPAARRLAAQGAPEGLDVVASELMPSHAPFLPLLRRRAEAVFAEAAGGREGMPHAWAVREALLATALGIGGASEAGAFARAVIERAARLAGGAAGNTAALLRDVSARIRQAGARFDAGAADRLIAAALETAPGAHWPRATAPLALPSFDGPPGVLSAGVWPERREVESTLLGLTGIPSAVRWRELVRAHGPLLEGAVRHHGQLARVRRRLGHVFPEAMLQDVVVLLEPAQAAFVAEVVRRPELLRPPRTGAVHEAPARVRRYTWEFTLGYLLVNRGSRFNRQSYLGSLVRQMAAHDNLDHRALLADMLAPLEALAARTALQEELVLLVRALWREAGAGQVSRPSDPQALRVHAAVAEALLHETGMAHRAPSGAVVQARAAWHPRRFQRLRSLQARPAMVPHGRSVPVTPRVFAAFDGPPGKPGQGPAGACPERREVEGAVLGLTGIPSALRWRELVRTRALRVEGALRHHGQLARVRRRLAHAFPEAMLQDMVVLLEPAEAAFVAEVVRRPEVFRPDGEAAVAPEPVRRRAWEFTLGYLLVNRGSRFNRQSYLGGLVRRMAARDNLDHRALLKAMHGALSALGARTALQEALVELLGALLQEAGAQPARAPSDSPARRAHAAVVAGLLQEPVAAYGGTLAAAITTLATQHPGSFEGLLRRLRARAPAALPARLDDGALEALVLAWASHGQGRASPFATAIEAAARQVPGRRAFFSQVLLRLLRNEAVDVEALAARAGRAASAPADPHGIVRAWLVGGPADDMLETWTMLLQTRSQALQPVLRAVASRSGGVAALARVFSTRMLEDTVRLAQPAASAFVLAGVTALQRVTVWSRRDPAPHGADSAVWEFTLAWLLGDRGTAFNRRAWLAALVRQMAASRNLRVEALLAALMDQLAAVARPGGAEAGVMALLQAMQAEETARRPRPPGAVAPALRRGLQRRPPARRAPPSRAWAGDPVLLLARRLSGFDAAAALPPAPVLAAALARASDAALQALTRALEERGDAVERLLAWLPEPVVEALLLRLRPGAAAALLACVDVLGAASRDAALTLTEAHWWRLRLRFALRWLIVEGRNAQPAAVARAFAGQLATHVPAPARHAWRARLRERLADDRSLDRDLPRAIADARSDDDGGTARAPQRQARQPDALPAPGEVLHVANAGMVLAAPYLPRLFGMVGLLEEGRFRDEAAAARAVHLLQYLVDGATQSPEPVLLLNKILCGVPLDTPVPRDVALTEAECTAVEGLLGGIIANWTALGRTSVAGLRETFLQREGRLTLKDDAWHLLVEPRAFDMLLDRLPWSIATLRLAWMDRVLHVEWR